MPVLLYDHDHLALASAIKLAKKNSLPATEQKFALAKRNGHGRADQTGFDVRIGIFFAMPEAHPVLRNQSAQQVQHVSRDVRIGILVDRETGGSVLNIQHDQAFLLVGGAQLFLNCVSELNQLLALMRSDF